MVGILETQRSALEELERIEQAIADRILNNPGLLPDTVPLSSSSVLNGKRKRPLKETVLQQHEISRFIERYEKQCKYLKESFEPVGKTEQDSSSPAAIRKRELVVLGSGSDPDTSVLDTFYGQMNQTKDFYRRYPNGEVENLEADYQMRFLRLKELQESGGGLDEDGQIQQPPSTDDSSLLLSAFASDINVDSVFSGEENYGRFLDLISFHERFLNLKFVRHNLTYIQYLDKFSDYQDISLFPSSRGQDPNYFTYASELCQYLQAFLTKSRVLNRPEDTLAKIDQDFEAAWQNKSFPSWSLANASLNENTSEDSGLPQDGEETEKGVFCTACSKFFSNQAVYSAHLTGKKHKRAAVALEESASKGNVSDATSTVNSTSSLSDIKLQLLCRNEFITNSLVEFLFKQISDTKNNVERKRALTDRERQLEIESQDQLESILVDLNSVNEDGINADDSEDEDVIYNPLKLPLGWDGKPIPFWLWKLNGLGIEYYCEICGNYCYMGRKAFEKHFMEPRHIHGLKCLDINNALLFKGITSIKEALALADKVRMESRKEEGRKENTVEMEDEEGNVMSEKVYNDLKRQGLL